MGIEYIFFVILFAYYTTMSILVYNGEKFRRNKLRYLGFTVVFACIFLLSILNNNVVGAVLIFFLLWWYFYYSTINNQVIKMTISDIHLIIGNNSYPWSTFTGYVIELFPKEQKLKNIVLITEKWHMIYSFDDSLDTISLFLSELNKYLPQLGTYHQSFFEKFSRKMKL